MATVVAGWWAESGRGKYGIEIAGEDNVQPLVRLLAVGYIAFVGFTRFVLKKAGFQALNARIQEGWRRLFELRGCVVKTKILMKISPCS